MKTALYFYITQNKLNHIQMLLGSSSLKILLLEFSQLFPSVCIKSRTATYRLLTFSSIVVGLVKDSKSSDIEELSTVGQTLEESRLLLS